MDKYPHRCFVWAHVPIFLVYRPSTGTSELWVSLCLTAKLPGSPPDNLSCSMGGSPHPCLSCALLFWVYIASSARQHKGEKNTFGAEGLMAIGVLRNAQLLLYGSATNVR